MAKPILPEKIRRKIRDLFKEGYSKDDVFRFIKHEVGHYVESDKQLWKCISSIKSRVVSKHEKTSPVPPKAKEFDSDPFKDILAGLRINIPKKKLEKIGTMIATDILKTYEGFKKVEEGPDFQGTPFDLFGFKKGIPYIIELKCSMNNFQYPGETQKKRMQELLVRIDDLGVVLLQLKLRKSQYRIFYDDELNLLFYGRKAPLEPIEDWIRKRML